MFCRLALYFIGIKYNIYYTSNIIFILEYPTNGSKRAGKKNLNQFGILFSILSDS